jgi:isopenicillin-N epimerase
MRAIPSCTPLRYQAEAITAINHAKARVVTNELRDYFLLDPAVTFLNHGSYGACPTPVFESYQAWQLELERQPVEFLGRRHDALLADAREALAGYLNCRADDLVFVTNATWGVNIIIRSLDLEPDDEILTTNHEYGANTMAWDWLLAKSGARLVRHEIPLPVTSHDAIVESLWGAVNDRTRAIFISHITSPTALTLPVQQICQRAREHGILTIIDGAHGPGQIDIDLQALGADIYTGNLHKWLCAPKGAGFLYVRPEEQPWVESLIISWGWGRTGVLDSTSFVERNEWQGTRDIAPFLAVPDAIAFQAEHDWPQVRERCHQLARQARREITRIGGKEPILPDDPNWFSQMVACPVPIADAAYLKERLYNEFRVEIPVSRWDNQTLVRVSLQAYNDAADLEKLYAAMCDILATSTTEQLSG